MEPTSLYSFLFGTAIFLGLLCLMLTVAYISLSASAEKEQMLLRREIEKLCTDNWRLAQHALEADVRAEMIRRESDCLQYSEHTEEPVDGPAEPSQPVDTEE